MAISEFEKYDIISIKREEIKNAPYNPRTITAKAKRKLQEFIAKNGLIAPITWNKRTGHIVGGHQRIVALDAVYGRKDYELTVSAVDLSEHAEKEHNVFLNNKEAQGDFSDELRALLSDSAIDLNATGFELSDIYKMYGENPIIANHNNDNLLKLSEGIRQAQEIFAGIGKKSAGRDDPNFYLVVVFKDYNERKEFTDKYGLPDNKYISAKDIALLLKS